MPKEITHWLIARQVTKDLRGTEIGELAAEFPNCVDLGAVMHDTPYYAGSSRWKQPMQRFANIMHGRGIDAFSVIHSMSTAATMTQNPAPVRAMIIGMLTHIAADSIFHPLVYHETGNYRDPDPALRTRAVQQHRRFETALDVYLAGTLANIRNFSLRRMMRDCEIPVAVLLREAFITAADDFTCPGLPDGLLQALQTFKRMQAVYTQPFIGRIAEFMHPVLPHKSREITALFYCPASARQALNLHGPHSIPDPGTGSLRTCSIRELYDKAVALSLELCSELGPAVLGKAAFQSPRKRINGDGRVPDTPMNVQEPEHA
jgi:hypothetical protein